MTAKPYFILFKVALVTCIAYANFVLIVPYLLYELLKLYRKWQRMPPGPYGLPFIGVLSHFTNSNVLHECAKYKEKYGNIFLLRLGLFDVVVLNDYKLIIEAFKRDEFSGRPPFEITLHRNFGVFDRGTVFASGGVWQEQRRFSLRHLRDFGFGKGSMEALLHYELEELVKYINMNMTGKPVSLNSVFNASILNSLWHILAGKRFQLGDPKLKELVFLIAQGFAKTGLASPALFFPWPAKRNLYAKGVWDQLVHTRNTVYKVLREQVDEHLETFNEDDIRDFIDCYILHIRNTKDASSSFYGEEGKLNLLVILYDLFVAGAETTSTTLLWGILYLTQNPGAVKKLQAEIQSVLGKRMPSRDDRDKLVYSEAVVCEIHRMAALFAFAVNHCVTKDVEFAGYLIPEGTVVWPNVRDAHYDVKYWKDPNVFRPERFLDESETRLIRHEPLMPFSTGKRSCIGETLARDSVLIFLVGFMQSFSVQMDPECTNPDLSESPSFLSAPKPYKVILTPR